MGEATQRRRIKLRSVFHPSDFSQASDAAFWHALRIALTA